jgi:hypothetical protein
MPRNSNVERMQNWKEAKQEERAFQDESNKPNMTTEEYKRWQRVQQSSVARELRGLCGCKTATRVTAAIYIGSDSESRYCTTPDGAR